MCWPSKQYCGILCLKLLSKHLAMQYFARLSSDVCPFKTPQPSVRIVINPLKAKRVCFI
jgi:hypothetical protein